MKRKDRSRTPELLARIFEALVVTATALLIVLAAVPWSRRSTRER